MRLPSGHSGEPCSPALYRVSRRRSPRPSGNRRAYARNLSRGLSPRNPITESKPPLWLRQARDLLHDQFTESPSLGDIAEAVGVHPAHLARVFRQRYHCSIGDYLRNLRFERARHLLSSSDASLGEVGTFLRLFRSEPLCKCLQTSHRSDARRIAESSRGANPAQKCLPDPRHDSPKRVNCHRFRLSLRKPR